MRNLSIDCGYICTVESIYFVASQSVDERRSYSKLFTRPQKKNAHGVQELPLTEADLISLVDMPVDANRQNRLR